APPPPQCPAAFPLPTRTGTVGPGYEIHLRDPDGNELDGRTLSQGAYRLELDDNADIHNFHLVSADAVSCIPRVDCATSIEGTGHETWTVNFTPGTVTYQCDPHQPIMHGTFT